MADGRSLPSWNDSAAKSAILDFVARVTEQGGTEFFRQPGALPRLTTTGHSGASSRFRYSSFSPLTA